MTNEAAKAARKINGGRAGAVFVAAVVALMMLAVNCGPAADAPETDSAVSVPQPPSTSQNPHEALDLLGAVSTSIESFRVTETQVNSGVRGDAPWTRTSRMDRDHQAPDRERIVFFAVEYVRDTDGDGIFEEVAGGSSCETQEAVTIGATFYERCDAESWEVAERRSAYVMPVQVADDLLVKVSELEDLRLLTPDMIDGRAMLVFEGNVPDSPPGVTKLQRTVWIDAETALVRRTVETIQFENEDIAATAEYTDYNAVVIEEPVTG